MIIGTWCSKNTGYCTHTNLNYLVLNKYFHVAVLLTSISFSCLPVAIATEQVSLDYKSTKIDTLKTDRSLQPSGIKITDHPDFKEKSQKNVHQELNAIANKSLITVVLDGKLKTKTVPQLPLEVVSNHTIAIVKEFEGFRSSAYIDTDGTPVIGYGQSRINGKPVKIGDRISASDADAALQAELQTIQQELLSVVKVNLNDNQLAALTSLAFNTGVGSIKKSTLVKNLNQQDYLGAANQFLRWNKADIRGQLMVMDGLTRRRNREKQLFLAPISPLVAVQKT